jgi:hypothetical protein
MSNEMSGSEVKDIVEGEEMGSNDMSTSSNRGVVGGNGSALTNLMKIGGSKLEYSTFGGKSKKRRNSKKSKNSKKNSKSKKNRKSRK